MRGSSENLIQLRHLLAERFPEATRRSDECLPTGIAPLDEAAGGGLPAGAITEVVSAAPSCGGELLTASLLASTRRLRLRMALIDGDAFDPVSHEPDLLQHLVWARCRTSDEALQATDLLVRDANFSLILLDLRGFTWRRLRSLPVATWYRLQRALEGSGATLLAQTPAALVSSAALRFSLGGSFDLERCDGLREELAGRLQMKTERRRLAMERMTA